MKSNTIVISVEEYRDLLTRKLPDDNDRLVIEKIKDLILDNIKYQNSSYDTHQYLDMISDDKFIKELLTLFKILDKNFYIELVKFVMDKKQKEDNEKALMEKARAIKDIKED